MSSMCGSSQHGSLLTLGHVFITHPGAAYEQAVISGQVILHNASSGNLERMRIDMEPASHCCIFPLSQTYVPRLASQESKGIDFRLSSLERCISARVSVEYKTEGQPHLYRQELLIKVEPESLGGLKARQIFVSYTRTDYQRIQPLLAGVRTCGSVWIDEPEKQCFEWFAPRIREGVRNANVFLVFLSDNAIRSPSVQDEIRLALVSRARGERLAMVAAALEPCLLPPALAGLPFVAVDSKRDSSLLLKTLKDVFRALEIGMV